MEKIKLSYSGSFISQNKINKAGRTLQKEIKGMSLASKKGYGNDKASINLPTDEKALNNVIKIIKAKKALNPEYLVVVGIGGSNLGTIAVQEAVLGKFYNQLNPRIKILYSDTVDSDSVQDILGIIEPVLKKGKNIIINGVSKSGGTTETMANFEIFIRLLKKYKKNYEKYVVVTSDKGSKYWNLALEKGFGTLEIPKKVGGRYSVFSPVGLFPLGLIGVNIDKLLEGAALMRKQCLNKNIKNNPAALSAILLYLNSKKGKNIADLFLFSNDLESVGKWYRQLMGESIGKEFSVKGKKIHNGITPTVSIGSTDLHSMAQLYLGGPYDKFTAFVRVRGNKANVKVPDFKEYSNLVDKIQGKSLEKIMNAVLEGTKAAFRKGKRPFMELALPDKSESSIGQLLQLKMMEIMYLGFLMEVNPFDQPNVEDYKAETKRILSGGSF